MSVSMLTTADIIKLQRTQLDKLQALTPKLILIKCIEGAAPEGADYSLYIWNNYKDVIHKAKEPIYTRGILLNELLFDPDVKNWNTLKPEFNKIIEFCRKEQIPLQLAYSGGSGVHGSIIFNSFLVDNEILDKSAKMDIDIFKIVRNVLIDLILEGAGTNKLALALDPKKINFSKNRSGSQVREYGTTRPDGHFKTLIDHIPESKAEAQELPLVFPDEIKTWNIPDKYNRQINEAILKEIEKSKEYLEYNTEAIDLRGNKLKAFPCIAWLLENGALSGNRHYGAGSITLMAKRCGINWTKTQELINQFFSKCEITEAEAKIRIEGNKNYFDKPEYLFSCREIKKIFGVDICKFDKCVLRDKINKIKDSIKKENENEPEQTKEHITEKANEILNTGGALVFIIKTYHEAHIGDDITGKMLLTAIGSQSVKNSSGLQPKVSGSSGGGKTHAVSAIMHLVPEEYVFETTLSDKAIYHTKNTKPGTIINSDDVNLSEVLQGIIKRATTNFQKYTKDTITVKKDGEFTTESLTIPPRIIWVLTSVNDTGSMEFLNRQLNLAVDETTEQDARVMALQLKKAASGEVDLPLNDDVLICREIIRTIKNKLFTVIIPYAERIEWGNPENRRNLNQFLDIIKSFAVFDYGNRKKVNEDTIEASEEDFYNAVSLYTTRAANQRFKLNDNELKILSKMIKGQDYDLKTLQDSTGLSYQTLFYLFNGRNGKTGLLEKVPELTTRTETLDLGEEESGYQDSTYIKMKVHRPRNVYILNRDFKDLSGYGAIARLRAVV